MESVVIRLSLWCIEIENRVLHRIPAFIKNESYCAFDFLACSLIYTARISEGSPKLGNRGKAFIKHCISYALCNKRYAYESLITGFAVHKTFKQIAIFADNRNLTAVIAVIRFIYVKQTTLTLNIRRRYDIGIVRKG